MDEIELRGVFMRRREEYGAAYLQSELCSLACPHRWTEAWILYYLMVKKV